MTEKLNIKDYKENPIAIYEANGGISKVEVLVSEETVWLTLNQISDLFDRDKSVISRHLKNIFAEEELDKDSTVAFFATVQKEGERTIEREIEYFNLDAILSVGYRVNSKKGVQFRRWASGILKEYLINGYSLNNDKLIGAKVAELQQAVDLLSRTLTNNEFITSEGISVLEIIRSYAKTWDLLIKYDEDRLTLPTEDALGSEEVVTYLYAKEAIENFKKELKVDGLFGIERGEALKGILGNIMQSFGGVDLYPTKEEKAAHLLYFVIKDHPFSDGNKRIGSLLFLLYLQLAGIGLKNMNESTLTALALLTAESDPSQKDLMIKLIVNLIV